MKQPRVRGVNEEEWQDEEEQHTIATQTKSRLHCLRLRFSAKSVKSAIAWSILHLGFVVGQEYIFFDYQHFDNNYANKTLPVGPATAPQNFDCHQRNTGILVATVAMVLSLVLMPIALSLDPIYGFQNKSNQ